MRNTMLLRHLPIQQKQYSSLIHLHYKCFHHEWRVSQLFPLLQGAARGPATTGMTAQTDSGPNDIGSVSQKLMTSKGLIKGAAPGTFHILPYATRSLEKLYRIIDREMFKIGAQKITMPCLSAAKPWHDSGRWDVMGSELFVLKDRKGGSYCLSPTHEEAVTSIVAADSPLSYKRLPVKLYQIGRKFRDEMRPKSGLLRCREFEMKDLYTFDDCLAAAKESYEQVCSAYDKIFTRLGLKYVKVEADTGAMGGTLSHEYQLLAEVGEDTIFTCEQCDKSFNSELIDTKNLATHRCDKEGCGPCLRVQSGIEVAHAFLLGTRYSSKFNALYTDSNQRKSPLVMGCFGIGVTRLLAAALEVSSQQDQIRWPRLLAPHQIIIIPQKEGYKSDVSEALCSSLYQQLTEVPHLEGEVLIDDRLALSIGKRLHQAKQMGIPFVFIAGKRSLEETPLFEVVSTEDNTSTFLSMEAVIYKAKQLETIRLW